MPTNAAQLPSEYVPPPWWAHLTGPNGLELHFGSITMHGRPLLLAVLVIAFLLISAPLVWLSGQAELKKRWITWLVLGAIVGPMTWLGRVPTAALAAVVAFLCAREYVRLVQLTGRDQQLLEVCAVAFPFVALLAPGVLAALPFLLILVTLLPLLDADTDRGGERAGYLTFGVIWVAWAPAQLVLVYHDAFLIIFAVAVTDVSSWVGGKTLGRLPYLRNNFSDVSPNKTIGGLVGGALGAALILVLTGSFTIGLFTAVAVGAPLGDLIESMFKRQAKVKDAGDWLPGFGGILDRVDSLLLVLPLAALLTGVYL